MLIFCFVFCVSDFVFLFNLIMHGATEERHITQLVQFIPRNFFFQIKFLVFMLFFLANLAS